MTVPFAAIEKASAKDLNLLAAPAEQVSPFVQRLLDQSKANKAKYDKQRLDDYNKRNWGDYFRFIEGSVRNKKDPTEAERAILQWLENNK